VDDKNLMMSINNRDALKAPNSEYRILMLKPFVVINLVINILFYVVDL